jgi:hypothetical protein
MPRAGFSSTTNRAPGVGPAPTFSSVEVAHAGLVERLAGSKPHRILYIANARDLEERAEHLQQVLGAVLDHVGAIVADTDHAAPGGSIDRKYLLGLISDLASNVAGSSWNFLRSPYSPSSSAPPHLFGFPLLRIAALLSSVLVEDLQHGSGETSDGLRPRRQVRLFATPAVQALQKFTGEPHLKWPILDPSRRAPHKCIDLYSKCHYTYHRPNGWLRHPSGPNPSQRKELWLRLKAVIYTTNLSGRTVASGLSNRRSFIGGSDARIIMGQDEKALIRLWQEKRGEIKPEDLSGAYLRIR